MPFLIWDTAHFNLFTNKEFGNLLLTWWTFRNEKHKTENAISSLSGLLPNATELNRLSKYRRISLKNVLSSSHLSLVAVNFLVYMIFKKLLAKNVCQSQLNKSFLKIITPYCFYFTRIANALSFFKPCMFPILFLVSIIIIIFHVYSFSKRQSTVEAIKL